MDGFEAPDIRYNTLTSKEHDHEDKEHPSYTKKLLEKAITRGIDPTGNPLEPPMPQGSMSDEGLTDLIDYLKAVE